MAGGFRTVYGFRGFRYLADVAFEWILWTLWISIFRQTGIFRVAVTKNRSMDLNSSSSEVKSIWTQVLRHAFGRRCDNVHNNDNTNSSKFRSLFLN